jgi:thiol-disulfide isomerase/thioredoxin
MKNIMLLLFQLMSYIGYTQFTCTINFSSVDVRFKNAIIQVIKLENNNRIREKIGAINLKEGKGSIVFKKVAEPTNVLLETEFWATDLILEPASLNLTYTDTIDIGVNCVKGGYENNMATKHYLLTGPWVNYMTALFNLQKLETDSAKKIQYGKEIQRVYNQLRNIDIQFIEKNINSFKALDMLNNRVFYPTSDETFIALAKTISKATQKKYPNLYNKINQIYIALTGKQHLNDMLALNKPEKKYILLDFFGSWCKPCHALLPSLKEFYNNNSNHITLIGIALEENEVTAKNYIKENNITWPVKIVLDKPNTPLKNNYPAYFNVAAYPTLILLDNTGKQVFKSGSADIDVFKEMERIIQQ